MIAVRVRRMPVGGHERRSWWVTIVDGTIVEVGPDHWRGQASGTWERSTSCPGWSTSIPTASSAAMTAGLGTVMGAPNARRGGSHVANLSTREALAAGCLTALASDYHPPSLLAAAYLLADSHACSWVEAVDLVAAGPARLAGLDDRGVIEPGRRADLVAVSGPGRRPRVVQTWVGGRPVLGLPVGAGAQ